MEWGVCEDRVAIVALHRCGMPPTEIMKTLTPLVINERLVFCMLSKYKEANDVSDCPRSGWPHIAQTREVVRTACARVMRNPLQKQIILTREMQIALRTMSHTLHDDLGLRAYKCYTRHLLTTKLKDIRCVRAQKLLESYGSSAYRDILFTDEKIFDIEAAFDKQNDRVYTRSSIEAREKMPCVQREHH